MVNALKKYDISTDFDTISAIFDEVHEEALDSLFLNVYSIFAKDKKKSYVFEINTTKVARSNSVSQPSPSTPQSQV